MNSDKLVDRLEAYSNAIVAFVVAQSVAFAFTFGVQSKFSCAVIADKILAKGLLTHFAASTVLAILAIQYLSRAVRRLSPVNHEIVRNIFLAKCVIVAIFTMIPIFLLYSYGVEAEPGTGRCAQPAQAGIPPLPLTPS